MTQPRQGQDASRVKSRASALGNSPQPGPVLCARPIPAEQGVASTGPADSSARDRGGEAGGVAILGAVRLIGSRSLPFARLRIPPGERALLCHLCLPLRSPPRIYRTPAGGRSVRADRPPVSAGKKGKALTAGSGLRSGSGRGGRWHGCWCRRPPGLTWAQRGRRVGTLGKALSWPPPSLRGESDSGGRCPPRSSSGCWGQAWHSAP